VVFRFEFIAALAVAVSIATAAAADRGPVYGPPPAWVQVAPIPDAPRQDDVAVQVLLDDNQSWLGPDGDVAYNRRVRKILKPEGLGSFTTFNLTWSPDTDRVAIHALSIIRNGKAIDLLQHGRKMLVLRRERDLESSILDGRVTASQQIEGLQVGDVVDIAWTQTHKDPVSQGHSYDGEGLGFAGAAARYRVRLSWPDGAPVRWRPTPGFGEPTISHDHGRTWLALDLHDVRTPHSPVGAPLRFRRVGQLETSSWASWAEISRAMWPYYAKAMSLEAQSPIRAEAAAIAAAHPDAKGRAYAALQVVEDQTRYFLLAIDQGGYVPAAADDTWRRKFGDCKGKTILLLALLKELGISAEPVLVNAGAGDGLDERLPSLGAFNHVMVKAVIEGAPYWLDGTRTGDRTGLDRLRPPPYDWALPLRPQGADLERIPAPDLNEPQMATVMKIDASKGLDQPAAAKISMRFTGDAAKAMRLMMTNAPKADLERAYKQQFYGRLTWFKPASLSWTDDLAHDAFALEMVGAADLDWPFNPDAEAREFKLSGANSSSPSGFPHREPGPNQDAPFAVPFPAFVQTEMDVVLPSGGKGFTIRGANGVEQIGGFTLKRASTLDGGVASFVSELRSVKREISPAEAENANKALRKLAEEQTLVRAPRQVARSDHGKPDLSLESKDQVAHGRAASATKGPA
jgi:transglutaminase-like putative cysteine protease